MWKDNCVLDISEYDAIDFNPLNFLVLINLSGDYYITSKDSFPKLYIHPNGNAYEKNFGLWDSKKEAEEFLNSLKNKNPINIGCNSTKCICDMIQLLTDGCAYQKSVRLKQKDIIG